jgi:hypothetical protein
MLQARGRLTDTKIGELLPKGERERGRVLAFGLPKNCEYHLEKKQTAFGEQNKRK